MPRNGCSHDLVNIGAAVHQVTIWWKVGQRSSNYVGPVPADMGIGSDGSTLNFRVCRLCGVVVGLDFSRLNKLPGVSTPEQKGKLSYRMQNSRTLTVSCPTCQAPAGEPCQKVYAHKHKGMRQGKPGDQAKGYFHSARAKLARQDPR